MGRHPRYIPEEGALVEVTYRTVQGRFLFRPSQSVNDTVVGALARALTRSPEIGLVGIVVLSNHLHLLLTVKSQEHLSKLMETHRVTSLREAIRRTEVVDVREERLQSWPERVWGPFPRGPSSSTSSEGWPAPHPASPFEWELHYPYRSRENHP